MIDTLVGPRKMLGLPDPVHLAPVKKPHSQTPFRPNNHAESVTHIS